MLKESRRAAGGWLARREGCRRQEVSRVIKRK